MMVSVLSVWFALPNAAYAKTVTVEGRNINISFTSGSSKATATISYTEGSGKVKATVNGYAYNKDNTKVTTTETASNGYNLTPGGASASVSAPSGYTFYTADSSCSYEVYINGATYSARSRSRRLLIKGIVRLENAL